MTAERSRRNRTITYSAMFAAFYALGRLIPFSQFIGASGFVPLSNSFILIYALLLGPIAGSLSAVLGTLISYFLGKPPIFLGLDFLTPLAGVMAAGFMLRRHHLPFLFVSFVALLIIFNLSPLTLPFVSVPFLGPIPWTWLHLVALATLLLYSFFGRTPVSSQDPSWRLLAKCGASSFVGLLLQQLVGDLLFEAVFGLYGIGTISWAAIWTLDFYSYPWEWAAFTLISVALAVPIYRLVSKRFSLVEA
jgi:uncharacterized membrane protein